jgi:predicted ArsR family transcriptional regulator
MVEGAGLMSNDKIPEDLLALLALIDEYGSTVCVGTCEHRKPGELHCLNISQLLKISTTGVKNRLRKLVMMGYLDRDRVKREDGKVMGEYTLSEDGLKLLKTAR